MFREVIRKVCVEEFGHSVVAEASDGPAAIRAAASVQAFRRAATSSRLVASRSKAAPPSSTSTSTKACSTARKR